MHSSVSIHPLSENDISAFVRVELNAFASHPRTPMVWRHGYTPALYAYYEASKTASFHEPDRRFLKALDDATGTIVGVAEWTLALDAQQNANATPPDPDAAPPTNWPAGGNWALRRFYEGNTWAILQEFFAGRPYIMLDILTVNPEVHATGIGTKLLAWGVQQADERGVAMCLESTPVGLALYQKFGFRPARYIRADMREFGWDQPYDEESAKRVFMIREARPRI